VPSSSYGSILRSSAIVGGAQGINYAIGLIRTKIVAVLLGPAGVGLVGLYLAITGFVEIIVGLGLRSSGIRELADSAGRGDVTSVGTTARALNCAGWLSGVAGCLLTVAMAYSLSMWVFDSPSHAVNLGLLGVTILLNSLFGIQTAILQGLRHIGDLARLSILGAVTTTLIAAPLYLWLRQDGIVPVLILTSICNLVTSWWFVRKIRLMSVSESARRTLWRLKSLVGLGLAFMWSALLLAGVGLVVRTLIQRELGADANGFYQAAWAISGLFAGFVLGAMGTDFYPRLTACNTDPILMKRLVNEQTEIGVLLALPGLVATIVFAPWAITILYSSAFLPAADLLPLFALSVLGRVVAYPMSFVMLAVGAARWYALSETCGAIVHMLLVFLLLPYFGLFGTALAAVLLSFVVTTIVFFISARLIGFSWSPAAVRLLLVCVCVLCFSFALSVSSNLHDDLRLLLGCLLTISVCVFCLKALAYRLGGEHRIVKALTKIPLGRLICPAAPRT
jgi:antigen flippase